MMQKASVAEAMNLVSPYIQVKVIAESYVDFQDLGKIRAALSPYNNVTLAIKVKSDGYAYLMIQVFVLLGGTMKEYEIRDHGRHRRVKKQERKEDLSWVDELEGYDAFLDD